jgi:hypothetical protein
MARTKQRTGNPIQDASNLMAAVLETLSFDLTDENFDGTPAAARQVVT